MIPLKTAAEIAIGIVGKVRRQRQQEKRHDLLVPQWKITATIPDPKSRKRKNKPTIEMVPRLEAEAKIKDALDRRSYSDLDRDFRFLDRAEKWLAWYLGRTKK